MHWFLADALEARVKGGLGQRNATAVAASAGSSLMIQPVVAAQGLDDDDRRPASRAGRAARAG